MTSNGGLLVCPVLAYPGVLRHCRQGRHDTELARETDRCPGVENGVTPAVGHVKHVTAPLHAL
jgi:hypothetical protein